jgi:hypothetical protein
MESRERSREWFEVKECGEAVIEAKIKSSFN